MHEGLGHCSSEGILVIALLSYIRKLTDSYIDCHNIILLLSCLAFSPLFTTQVNSSGGRTARFLCSVYF